MKTRRNDPTQTMLAIAMGFLALFLLFDWKWAVWASLFIGCTGLLSPFLSEKTALIWAKSGSVLGLLIPSMLLSVVFYLLLYPVAALSKLFGKKDPLVLKNRLDSMYTNNDQTFSKDSFEKTW